jgi:hypothetical protein
MIGENVEPDFGDLDPEDAYDSGDDPEMRLAVIERVVADLRVRREEPRFDGRRLDFLRVVEKFISEGPPQVRRLEELHADLEAM